MPATNAPQPNPHGPQNRGPALISMFSVWSIISMAFMAARMWSRMKQHHVGIDDICMLFATILFVTFTILIIIESVRGGFQHLYYVDKNSLVYILKLNYIAQPINTMSEVFGKISIAFFLLRVMGATSRWKKWSLYILITLTVVIGIITSFLTFFQCDDPRALWDKAHYPNVKCWNPMVETRWAIFTSSWFTFVDFFLAGFPVMIVWKLNMGWKKKLAICILLGLGTITGILSALKTQQIYALSKHSDGLWTSYLLGAYAGGEVFLMITLGSIPAIRIFFDKVIGLAVSSRIYISLRRLVTRGSHSRLDENHETGSKEMNTNGDHRDHELQQGSKSTKGFNKSKSAKQKVPHPLDIPQSLLSGNNSEFTTSVHAGKGEDWQARRGGEESNAPGNNAVKVVQSFEVV